MLKEYTPNEAVAELHRRREDPGLTRVVEEYIGIMPDNLPNEPFTALCRQVATGRGEDIAFADLSHRIGLVPFWPTYVEDRFTTRNPDKVKLCKLSIEDPKQPEGYSNRKVVKRMDLYDGTASLAEVKTGCFRDGEQMSLPSLHQHLRSHALNGSAGNTADFSGWLIALAKRGGIVAELENAAKEYYPYYLALFVCHGVLVEDFSGGPNSGAGLANFVYEVVRPAVGRVRAVTGYEPIYVRLPWQDSFGLYPSSIAPVLDSLMSRR